MDISLERPWTFYEYIEPLTVQYDGGISLYGLALGQGEEQLSTQHPLDLGQERSLWGVLRWQTAPGLEIDYAISLRLYNAEGERVYQADDVLWQTPIHAPTSQWSADEPVNTLVQLEFPPDIPAGDYELRMVVYNFETQVPTVELGVWEPEITLARPAAGGSQVTGDPTEERVKRREKRENTSHSSPLWRRHRTEQLRFRIPAAAFAGQTHAEKFSVATRWQHPLSSSFCGQRLAPVVNQRLCP